MSHNFHNHLHRIWEHSVGLYKAGQTHSSLFPIDEELPLLSSWGIKRIDIFDFAEDWCLHQEPDFSTFLLVHYERWRFFCEEQKGVPSSVVLDPTTLPPREEEFCGIPWLPRILPKAWAKLRGELPPEVMYCCGGDREFFKTNNIHPAEFLAAVRSLGDRDEAIIDWVVKRKSSLA
jgi:hypothetical protein